MSTVQEPSQLTETVGGLTVEMAGTDVIPESRRKGKPSDLFMPWFAANIAVLGISWGAWVLGFGISFSQAVVASLIGVVASFLLVGLIAIAGKRGSAPTLVLSRAPFGYNGNRISAAISWILTVGWETFLCVMAVLAAATVMGALGFGNHTVAQVIALVGVVLVAGGAGVLGFDTLMKAQTWITWITAALTIVYIVLIAGKIDFSAVTAIPAGPTSAVIGALVMVLTGFGLGWVNTGADYSRYLPRTASTRGVVGWTTFGAALPTVALVLVGLLLAGSNPELAAAVDADPIGAISVILPTWFLVPFAIVAILGLIGGIIMDIYSSGLSLLATGLPVARPVATAIDGTIMTIGTIVIVFFTDSFFGAFQGFLITLGVVIAGWAGVMLADITLRRKDYAEADLFTAKGIYGSVNWTSLGILVVATVVGWGFVVNTSAGWLSWQGYLLGAVGGKDGGWAYANLGVLFALVIGYVGYLVLCRGRVAHQEKTGSLAHFDGGAA
ncbi:purine-cytosine permease-like protein [Salana multivorans]|uniref:Purine-cytosine permease-like protein n=1 Tax=Salana multivorans TaxID=120377 RepID=A0A3N2D0C6_9MICO|nr:cytosine permease [Salana multivorans]MBN8882009.1 cytosine permease [Salana multivorans]OJX94699.1 MAG: allantoin permease [Micrococcales bacterium 73-15]ROR93193.1 purine-cytosine permease-like protein [Salana multivorans]